MKLTRIRYEVSVLLENCKKCQFDSGELIEMRVPSDTWDGLGEVISHDFKQYGNPNYHVIKVQLLNGGSQHGKLVDYYANMLRKLNANNHK